jgi:hypothetical protein
MENAMLPIMYTAPSNKNIQKIVMDVKEEGSLEVVSTSIEKPAEEEKLT